MLVAEPRIPQGEFSRHRESVTLGLSETGVNPIASIIHSGSVRITESTVVATHANSRRHSKRNKRNSCSRKQIRHYRISQIRLHGCLHNDGVEGHNRRSSVLFRLARWSQISKFKIVCSSKSSAPSFGRELQRGDILVFYPPEIETGVPDNGLLGKYIPFVPESPPAFIKRVIGLPGDVISIENGVGVKVNGTLYAVPGATTPEYDLSRLGDIQGYSMNGKFIRPYGPSTKAIVVPQNSYFMMGDNRNASADSHVWGFVSKDRIVGRACLVFWKGEWLQSILHNRG